MYYFPGACGKVSASVAGMAGLCVAQAGNFVWSFFMSVFFPPMASLDSGLGRPGPEKRLVIIPGT